jgi:hypothetical protein
MSLLNNSEVSSNLLGHILYYFSDRLRCRLSNNFKFLHYMGGTAIVWVMAPFSSTDFDENIFFGLNKGPNFQNPMYSHI